MKRNLMRLAVLGSLLAASATTHAHRSWILPAATVLSSEDPWVTFDAAISNDIFHADYRAMQLDDVKVMAPDGSTLAPQNPHVGKYRSNFDLQLQQRGTYKIFTAASGLSARWETPDGKRGNYPGRGISFSEEGFAKAVPANAVNLQVTQTSRRQETFVTAGVPDEAVLAPTNSGFEMIPLTHPNDLYEGEAARFRFLIDGEPAIGAQIEVLAGGMRYRNSQDEIMVQTNKEGIAEITWPNAGMYWLEASYSDERATAPAQSRQGTYIATFEVLPQ